MKKLRYLPISFIFLCSTLAAAETGAKDASLKIRVINFKTCIEGSKLGKQEQTSFEALKKQMEGVLTEKEKTLNEMAEKFEDPDYLDSLSAEAETELKRKFRTLSQELTQVQGQYYEALKQTNFKVVQQLNEMVTKAAGAIAKTDNVDIILNEEGAFYVNPALDISGKVITVMDDMYEKEGATRKSPTAELPSTLDLDSIKLKK